MIDIHGVILSAISGSIDRIFAEPGEICISDDLIAEIRKSPGPLLEICVDSPGGDFQAACAISAAVSDWLQSHRDGRVVCFVGSLACSAAAYFLASLPLERVEIYAHRNSLLMFHGTHSDCHDAGASAMRDNARSLELCDRMIRDALLFRSTVPPSTIDAWLSEGRAGWLSAEEAKAYHILDAILDADADPLVFSPETTNALEKTAMNLPYLRSLIRNLKNQEPATQKPDPCTGSAEPVPGGAHEPTDPARIPADPQNSQDPAIPEDPAEEPKDPKASPEPGTVENAEELETLKETVSALQEAVAELQEKLLTANAQAEEAKEVANKLTSGLRGTSSPAANSAAGKTFQDALNEYRSSHPTTRYAEAYAAVAKANPALYMTLFQD